MIEITLTVLQEVLEKSICSSMKASTLFVMLIATLRRVSVVIFKIQCWILFSSVRESIFAHIFL
jgi:hypothetical protein